MYSIFFPSQVFLLVVMVAYVVNDSDKPELSYIAIAALILFVVSLWAENKIQSAKSIMTDEQKESLKKNREAFEELENDERFSGF